MGTLTLGNAHERISWRQTLAGLWPFLLFGPLTVLLSYPYPPPEWRITGWVSLIIAAVYLLSFLIGLGVGWRKGWPRWSFPYLGLFLLVAGVWVAGLITRMIFEVGPEWPVGPQIAIAVGAFTLVLGLLLIAARNWRPLRSLYQNVQQDWTQLSFALSLGIVLLFSTIDHEEDPVLTLPVLLPSVIGLFGALAYLRSTTRMQGVLALLFIVVQAALIRLVGGKPFYATYAAVLGVIIFIPILLELLPKLGRAQVQSPT